MLSDVAKMIFKDLYCFSEETIDDTFKRVAKEFAKNNEDYDNVYDLLKNNVFRPNTPVFFNAGTDHKIFSACYVVGLEDSMSSIYDIANVARKIFQHGSGIGIPIGNLREKDAYIYEGKKDTTPMGKSSGPISFMSLYDAVGATTKSGGRARRAAIMCVMPVWHPDIIDFVSCKEVDGRLANMNISVALTDKFMRSFKDNIPYELRSPSNGEPITEVNARQIWDTIIDMAWKTGDPGIIFVDTMNKYNTLQKLMLIQATNPCGEQPLGPFLACNLCSINVHKFCDEKEFDFEKLYLIAWEVMNYMDNLIDVMEFPDERFRKNVLKYRPVGIGLMGLSDAMFELDIPYDSPEGKAFAGKVMKTITTACIAASSIRAKEHGSFENYEEVKDDVIRILSEHTDNDSKVMENVRKYGVRNSQFTTAAPTGTTALSCDCSYGIEPCFGLIFQKTLVETGETVTIVNPIFKKRFENESWYTPELIEKIVANKGSLKGLRGIPKEVRDVFVVAHDIKYRDRIDVQSELQKYCSTGISSTLNLPSTATRDEVSELYRYAYQKGLKGVTIYRDGSKKSQPITFTKDKTQVMSNFERPNVLKANVHILETGNGKLYITISTYNGKPVEIFMTMGKSGQLFNVFSEALGRSISIALQHGVPVEAVVKTLIGINSDRPTWARFENNDRKPTQILSIPDGVAKLLQRYYLSDGTEQEEPPPDAKQLCPQCGTYSMILTEGCKICYSCGLSECS